MTGSVGQLQENEVLVLGVGNVLLTDEGVGVHVVREISGEPLSEKVTVYDGGVLGLDLLDLIQSHEKVILIDSIEANSEPGTIFKFNYEQVEYLIREHKTSLHQVDLIETIRIARFLGKCPEITIIGVQPGSVEWGLNLTPEVADKIPQIKSMIVEEIGKAGSQRGVR